MNYLTVSILFVVAVAIFAILWRQGAFLKISAYFDQTKEELRKCAWPTWEELRESTVVVFIAIALIGAFTVGIDFAIAWAVRGLVSI